MVVLSEPVIIILRSGDNVTFWSLFSKMVAVTTIDTEMVILTGLKATVMGLLSHY